MSAAKVEFKGTPGPWEACDRTNHVQTSVDLSTRELKSLQTICSVNSTFISEEEFKANQLLISKAPELFEVIKLMLEKLDHGFPAIIHSDLFYKAETLINQVNGVNRYGQPVVNPTNK